MFIDMHHHLIYGVDDGARDFSGTEKMIVDAVNNQVDTIITTPHVTPGQRPFPYEKYEAHLEEARAYLKEKKIALSLYTGSEVLYTPNTPYLLMDGRVPTLAGTQYVLVEFSPDDSFSYISEALLSVASAGYIPVAAHVERYENVKKADQLRALRRGCNALIQVNARTVISKHSFFRERYIRRIFDEGLVDFVSTDCHDLPGRRNHMLEAYSRLKTDLGEEAARALTHDNAEKILRESKAYKEALRA